MSQRALRAIQLSNVSVAPVLAARIGSPSARRSARWTSIAPSSVTRHVPSGTLTRPLDRSRGRPAGSGCGVATEGVSTS
eukprot:15475055-Alexandrium_andersonii.AAC.1